MGALKFQPTEKEGTFLIACPSIIEGDSSELENHLKSWLAKPFRVLILDFKDVKSFKPSAYRYFVIFNQVLKAHKRRLFVLNASPEIQNQICQDGLEQIFEMIQSPAEGLLRSAPAQHRVILDDVLNSAFIAAAKDVLETQANLSLKVGKAYTKKTDIPIGLAGVMSLVDPKFTGCVCLCFKPDVFLKIYESMVGDVHTQITREIEDASGEILNIIFGQVKTGLNTKGYDLQKALPTIMVGDNLELHHQGRSPVTILPFESPVGNFHMEILIERN